MSRSLPLLVVGIVLLATRPAAADHLRGAVGAVTETRHRVTVTMHRGYAVWEAERHLWSQGAGQAILVLDLPVVGPSHDRLRAVPVGLRLRRGTAWQAGALMGVEGARDHFFDGGGRDEAAALLEDGASLRVSGMTPGVSRVVGYRLLVPTIYQGGHYRLALPAETEAADIPHVLERGRPPTIVPRAVGGVLVVNGQPWPDGEPIPFDPGRGLELSLRPPVAGWTVDGALAVVPFGNSFLTHAHIEVVPELSRRPRRARVVLVIDRSRSVRSEALDGARAVASAYLELLEDAEVEIVSFARRPTRRFGRFVSAPLARRDLDRWRPKRGNGSELGAALTMAKELLESTPEGRPRRLVVLTDGKMRHDLALLSLTESLGGADGPLTQIVRVEPGHRETRIGRDDDSAWMEVAKSTGGLAWTGAFPVGLETPPDLAPLVERLVRPTTLTSFEVKSASFLDTGGLFVPSLLAEGEGVSVTALLDTPLPWLTATGKRWHDDVSVTLPVHDAEIPIWAALAFGNETLTLGDDAIAFRKLAERGGAVTEMTSYVVGRTVDRPPVERSGFGRFGHAHRFSTTCGGMGRSAFTFEGREWLENELRKALYACGAEEHHAVVALETIGREIAQVDGVTLKSQGAPATLAACLSRAAWGLDLPEKDFEHRPSRRWQVKVKSILP